MINGVYSVDIHRSSQNSEFSIYSTNFSFNQKCQIIKFQPTIPMLHCIFLSPEAYNVVFRCIVVLRTVSGRWIFFFDQVQLKLGPEFDKK